MNWEQYKRESSLEDVYNDLCKNRPTNKNCKPFKEWDYLESLLYEELLIEDERPRECEQLIDMAISFMRRQKERKLRRGVDK